MSTLLRWGRPWSFRSWLGHQRVGQEPFVGVTIAHRRNEPISLSGNGLDKARLFGIVAKHLPDFTDRSIDAVIGVNKNALAPNFCRNLFARDDLVSPSNQEEEDLHRDAFKLEHTPAPAQLIGLRIENEVLS